MENTKLNFKLFYLVFLIAVVVRIICIMGLAQGDDVAYAEIANNFSHGDFWSKYFFFYMRWVAIIPTAVFYFFFGVSDFSSLTPTILFSLLNVILAYRIVKTETNETTANIASILYACVPVIALYGDFLQLETYLESMTLLSMFFLQKAVRNKKLINFILTGLFIGLLPLTRESGFLVVPIFVIYLFYKLEIQKSTIKYLLLIGIISTIPMIMQCSIFYFFSPYHDFLHRFHETARYNAEQYALNSIETKDLFFYFKAFFIQDGFADYQWLGYYGYAFIASLVIFFTLKPKNAWFFLFWFVTYFCFLSFLPGEMNPYKPLVRNIRYMIILIFPLVTFVSICLNRLFKQDRRWLMAISVLSFIFLLVTSLKFSLNISSAFRNYHSSYAEMIKKVLNEKMTIYIIEHDTQRLYKYYNQFKNIDMISISDFNQISRSGLLAIPNHDRESRFFIPLAKVKEYYNNAPSSWELFTEAGGTRVYRVGPPYDKNKIEEIKNYKHGKEFEINIIPEYVIQPSPPIYTQSTFNWKGTWFKNDQILFTSKNNDEISFALNFETKGKYNLTIGFCTAVDYGKCSFFINDKEIDNSLDFFNPDEVTYVEKTFKDIELEAGRNVFKYLITGKNEKSKGFYFAIDAIKGNLVKEE